MDQFKDMRTTFRCPVCGAPIEGEKCEYCGCVIYDFANLDLDHPSYVRFKYQGMYITMKAVAINPTFEISSDTTYAYGNGSKLYSFDTRRCVTINLQLKAIEENGKLFEIIKPEKWYKASYEDDINEN